MQASFRCLSLTLVAPTCTFADMSITFKNAPLVELVAELQWEPVLSTAKDAGGSEVQVPLSLLDPSEFEHFFQRFGGAIYQHGFRQMERLIPHGAPIPHNRVACRYRHDEQKDSLLTQVGPSIFSVNALPPYKTWAEFRPWIERAVSALFEAQAGIGKLKGSVRYINVFKEPFLKGRNASEFFEADLGFLLNLPDPLVKRKSSGQAIRTAISTTIPLDGMQMTVKLSEAQTGGEQSAIMDTLVSISDEIEPDVAKVLAAFDAARSLIHETFLELTHGLTDSLKPEGDDDV